MTERRQASRPVAYFFVEAAVIMQKDNRLINAVTENISSKGIKVLCDELLSLGERIILSINLGNETVEKEAEVVWCEKGPFGKGFSAGLNFLSGPSIAVDSYATDSFVSYLKDKAAEPAVNLSLCKRFMDISLSLLLLFLLLPLILLVSLLIKIDSPGPIFYGQWRAGKYGKKFVFYKFRSMYHKNDQKIHNKYAKELILDSHRFGWINNKAVYKLIRDSRITKFGHILRKLSIDEIPQFFNVIKGDMSIVGPRPPILYELEFYNPQERKRLLARPGITGLWQTSGRSTTTFSKMIELDLEYIKIWSLWLDLRIMLKTPAAILKINEAY